MCSGFLLFITFDFYYLGFLSYTINMGIIYLTPFILVFVHLNP